MGEIVNLRRARKAKANRNEETQAASNRNFHGTPKALRKLAKDEKSRVNRAMDAHKLDKSS